jgi:hypothetical protein
MKLGMEKRSMYWDGALSGFAELRRREAASTLSGEA